MSDLNGQVKKRKTKREKVNEMLLYATEKYKCNFPKDFATILLNVAYMYQIPNNKAIDAIYQEWKIWEPYVEPSSFHTFFQSELKTLFKLQTIATFSSCMLNAYIGNKAVLKDCELPYLNTTVKWNGHLLVNGGVVFPQKGT